MADAIHHEGSGQMKYLKELMEKVYYTQVNAQYELLVHGQNDWVLFLKEKY